MRRKTLAQSNREALEAQAKGREVRWYVVPEIPLTRLFCSVGDKEHVVVMAAMLSRHTACSVLSTDVDGVVCVECDPPVETITLRESFMRGFMSVIRRNMCHGRYTCDFVKWYEF